MFQLNCVLNAGIVNFIGLCVSVLLKTVLHVFTTRVVSLCTKAIDFFEFFLENYEFFVEFSSLLFTIVCLRRQPEGMAVFSLSLCFMFVREGKS